MESNNGLTEENPFWDFSLKFYEHSAVSSSCLALQENVGADINILLYCCWVASEGALAIEPAELHEIIFVLEPWQLKVVSSLRQIRLSMKQERELNFGSLSESVRKSVKESELEAERLEQMILYDSGQKIFPVESVKKLDRVANAEINMRTYIEIISGNISETADSLILKICDNF